MTSFYDDIELTEQEIKDALLEARKRKYFHEKHAEFWEWMHSKNGKTETASEIDKPRKSKNL